jgi:hypothetical protein
MSRYGGNQGDGKAGAVKYYPRQKWEKKRTIEANT